MRTNYSGCAICDSTWGATWEEIDGERLFFCCPICAIQFKNVVRRVKESTGWDRIDAIEIAGDRRGRTATAHRGAEEYRCAFAFNADGQLLRFDPVAT